MADLKVKRAPQVESDQRAWETVYDDINNIINSVNQKSAVQSRDGSAGGDGDIRLFKDVDKAKYFIEGKFGDGWAKRELLFSDSIAASQDESINYSSTESYVRPDGTVDFTARVKGISPSGGNSAHLATKGYVDDNATSFLLTGPVTGGTANATGVATTISTDAIAIGMMQNNSVSTNELVADSVTYAKMQNVAGRRFLGRNTNSSGDTEEITTGQAVTLLALESGNADEYLCGNGTFREVTASTSMAGLNDTATVSLADGHFMRYQNSTSLWKNALLLAADIPNLNSSKITAGTLPVARGGTGITSGFNNSNWDTAYGWGDHDAENYIVNLILKEGDGGSTTVTNGNKYIDFRTSTSSNRSSVISGSGASNNPWVVTIGAPNTTYSVGDGGLTTNNFTDADHTKLNGIETSANNYNFELQDDDGHTVTINDGHYVKIMNGTGITTNWNAIDAQGTSGAPHILTISSTNNGTVVSVGVSQSITGGVSGGASTGTIGHNTAAGHTHVPTTLNNSGKFLKAGSNSGGSEAWTTLTKGDIDLDTSDDVRFDSFGVGTAASGTTGEIRATNEVTAYYSDDRLKDRDKNIENALDKLNQLNGFHYSPNALAESLGYNSLDKKVGVSAQEVLKVLPEAVTEAPIDPKYHAVQYDKLIPLIIEAIKELSNKGCCCGTK